MKFILTHPFLCSCFEWMGDNPNCPKHGWFGRIVVFFMALILVAVIVAAIVVLVWG